MTAEIALDVGQAESSSISADEKQVVIAGPGSGKTEVVAALVSHLVLEAEVDVETELLVVSFSRAAVEAVARRLRSSGVPAAAAVRTLDSIAGQILAEAADMDIASMPFEQRVVRATAVLREHGWDAVEELRHVVVDEMQDVVGVRAEFLGALLDALPAEAGFTLLGDPAQGIYDFQAGDGGRDLLEEVQRRDDVTTRRLLGSYRARTREARAAVALRHGARPDLGDAGPQLAGFVEGLLDVGELEGLVPLLLAPNTTTAVLTDTNGQALLTAHALWDLGVPVSLRRSTRRPVLDRWIAEHLGDQLHWTRDTYVENQADDHLASTRWKALRRVVRDSARGPALDTDRLALTLTAQVALPGELTTGQPAGTVVSTVHRAKGLEFDNVVLTRFPRRDDDPDEGAVARRLYVAVTRARSRLIQVGRPAAWGLRFDKGLDRWWQSGTGKDSWQTRSLEIRGEDLDRSEPGGADRERAASQLRSSVAVGDPLELALDPDRSTVRRPVYSVRHDDVVIGHTSSLFGDALARKIGPADKRQRTTMAWPRLTGARVDTVETVAGAPQREAHGGVGRYGLWLGVRPIGLVRLRWSEGA